MQVFVLLPAAAGSTLWHVTAARVQPGRRFLSFWVRGVAGLIWSQLSDGSNAHSRFHLALRVTCFPMYWIWQSSGTPTPDQIVYAIFGVIRRVDLDWAICS